MSFEQADAPVFCVLVSEKGGSERREVFYRAEITIGRVQGNDLMLPKGNVSKRHARLVYREGRFIVTDLNSTNGTYVNRRRISQATILKEGDKILIGDFVLRVEPVAEEGGAAEVSTTGSKPALVSPPAAAPPGEHRPRPVPPYDLSVEQTTSGTAHMVGPRLLATPHREPGLAPRPGVLPRAVTVGVAETGRGPERLPTASQPDIQAASHRTVLAALVERVVLALDSDVLEHDPVATLAPRVHELVWAQLEAMRAEGQIPPDLVLEQLARDAEAELIDLGPLASLLDDEETTEIAVLGGGRVTAVRHGRTVPVEPGFSSDSSLRRVVMRLCRRAGEPLNHGENVVERRLPGGSSLWAAFEPASLDGGVVLVRKLRRFAFTVADLVREGALSHPMATFLEQCVRARLNILVSGGRDPGTAAVASALCSIASREHWVALEETDDVVASIPQVTRLSAGTVREQASRLVALAAQLPEARLLAELAHPELASALLEAVGAGARGLVAIVRASSLRRALTRLVADLVVARPGLVPAAAREWVTASFDLMLEVACLPDGRSRVVRVSEVGGTSADEIELNDVFYFAVQQVGPDRSVEGSFQSHGTVPRLVEEITARGIQIDRSLFTHS